MTTTKKLVIAVVALSLALVAFASVTLAWITAQSTVVTNTFTYGKVEITLDEAKVSEYGDLLYKDENKTELEDRVTANKYKLIPGEAYTKDPTVKVKSGSEPCYVYVEVNNGLKNVIVATTIEDQMKAKGWLQISGTNIWYYNAVVDTLTEGEDIDLIVFESFKLADEIADIATVANNTITIKAYAVQSANLGTAEEAWAATSATFND